MSGHQTIFTNLLQRQRPKASLHNYLLLQEIHWRKKSRIRWLKEGNRNTTFFHTAAKSRGVVNCIDKILFDGSWVDDQKEIQSLAINHFSFVASTTHMDPSDFLFGLGNNNVSADMNFQLTTLPDANNIRSAVFALKKDSSLGLDGFSGYFFFNAPIPNTEVTAKVFEFDALFFRKFENFQDHSPQ
ncbi:hypothetical protein AAC387_Pa03g3798 [Persea americana]